MSNFIKYTVLSLVALILAFSFSATLLQVLNLFPEYTADFINNTVRTMAKYSPATSVIAGALIMFLIMARHSLMPQMSLGKKIYSYKIEIILIALLSNSYWFSLPALETQKITEVSNEDKLIGLNVSIHSLKAVEQLGRKIKEEDVDFVLITTSLKYTGALKEKMIESGFTSMVTSKQNTELIYSKYSLSNPGPVTTFAVALMEKNNKLYSLSLLDNSAHSPIKAQKQLEELLLPYSTRPYPTVVGGFINLAPTDPAFHSISQTQDLFKISYPLVSSAPWLYGVFGGSSAPVLGSSNFKFIKHEAVNLSGQKYRGEVFILGNN